MARKRGDKSDACPARVASTPYDNTWHRAGDHHRHGPTFHTQKGVREEAAGPGDETYGRSISIESHQTKRATVATAAARGACFLFVSVSEELRVPHANRKGDEKHEEKIERKREREKSKNVRAL